MPDENTGASGTGNKATTSQKTDSFWTASQKDISFWDIVQWLATFIVVPGVLLYPAGFLVFVLQICRFYPFDFWTAWYMTSLIPAPVVIGQGVKVLFWPLVVSLVTSLLFSRVRIVRSNKRSLLRTRLSPRNLPDAIDTHLALTTSTTVFLIFVVPISVMLLAYLVYVTSETPNTLYWAFFLPPAIAFALIGGWLISHDYYLKWPADKSHWGFLKGATEGWIIRGLLLAYAGATLSAFLTVLPMDLLNQDPDLPHLEMTILGKGQEDRNRTIEDGLLLANSDGYWHVIDTSSTDRSAKRDRHGFLMIPTNGVEDVKVYESPIKKADLDVAKMSPHESGWVNKDFKYAWADKELGYIAKVTNRGPDTATGVRLEVSLPAFTSANQDRDKLTCRPENNAVACDLVKTTGVELTIVSQKMDLRTCEAENRTVTCHLEKLDMDESAEISLKAKPKEKGVHPVPRLNVEDAEVDPDRSDEKGPDIGLWVDTTADGSVYRPDTWTSKGVTVNTFATDDLKRGVQVDVKDKADDRKRINIKRRALEDDSVAFPITDEGTWEVVPYRAEDKDDVGKATKDNSFIVKLDKTPPDAFIGSGPSGPTNNDRPTFKFDGSDEFPNNSSLRFSYKVDGEDWSPFQARTSATVGGTAGFSGGPHTFFVKARDEAGNEDTTREARTFTVDTTAPTISANATIATGDAYTSGTWTNKSVTVNLSANDRGGSGVKEIAYKVNGGKLKSTQKTSVHIPAIGEEGTANIVYQAEDKAGNSKKGEFVVKLDTTSPETRANPSPEPNDAGWNSGDVTVNYKIDNKVKADDKSASHVNEIIYSAKGAQEIRDTPYNRKEPLVITKQGVTEIAYHAKDNAGNFEKEEHLTVEIDKTAPSVVLDSGPSGSTNNDKPTFTFHGSDVFPDNSNLRFFYRVDNEDWAKASGTSVALDEHESPEDGKHTFYVKTTDEAGNEDATPAKRRFTVDTKEPKLELPGSITKEATSEEGAEVKYEVTATDKEPVNPHVSCSTESGLVSPGDTFPMGTTTVTCKATDEAGNETIESFDLIIRDTTPPEISGVPSNITKEATESNGAHVNWTTPAANDDVDGARKVQCSSRSGLSSDDVFPLGETTVSCSATDEASNKAESSFKITVRDTTKPAVKCEQPEDIWHKKDVTITCTAKDLVSDMTNFSLSTNVPTGGETESAATGSRKVCDEENNCATAGPVKGIKVDKKIPNITITAPDNSAKYKLREVVTANYACTDTGSGLASCEGSAPSGSDIYTGLGGSRSFKIEAMDMAGNTASKSHTYIVTYAFGGFLPPVEGPPTLNVIEAGNAVLVRFSLGGDRGVDIFAEGYPRSQKIGCSSEAPVNLISRGDLQHTASVDHYTYAWNTDETWSGSCRQLILKLNDGSQHLVNFKFVE